jgi:hypothetical protein
MFSVLQLWTAMNKTHIFQYQTPAELSGNQLSYYGREILAMIFGRSPLILECSGEILRFCGKVPLTSLSLRKMS